MFSSHHTIQINMIKLIINWDFVHWLCMWISWLNDYFIAGIIYICLNVMNTTVDYTIMQHLDLAFPQYDRKPTKYIIFLK